MDLINQQLMEACKQNCVDSVNKLLDKGDDVNYVNILGYTPLHRASRFKNKDVVRLLINKGANLSSITDMADTRSYAPCHTDTPLHLVVDVDCRGYVSGIYKSFRSCYGKPEELEIAKLLIDGGTDLSSINNKGNRVLDIAVINDDEEIVKLLIDGGADLTIVTDRGHSYLHIAVAWKYLGIAKLLIDGGVDLSGTTCDGYTPLHFAAINENTEIVKLLIDRGANLSAINDKKETPLHIAERYNNTEIVKLLV